MSLCSEPGIHRQHSGQSSIDHCVPEETLEAEERENSVSDKLERKVRPITLQIGNGSKTDSKSSRVMAVKKQLYRSNSSTLHYRPKSKPMTEYDQFYFTSTNGKSNNADEFLQIINERRKILKSESVVECTEHQESFDVKDNNIAVSGEKVEVGSNITQTTSQDCISRTDINSSECTSEKSTNNATVISSTTIALIHEMPIEKSEIPQKDTCHTADEGRRCDDDDEEGEV